MATSTVALLLLTASAYSILCTSAFRPPGHPATRQSWSSHGVTPSGNTRTHHATMHSSVASDSSTPHSTDDDMEPRVIEESRRSFLEWAGSNTVVDSDDGDGDDEGAFLEAIASAVGDARVVALSEGCHNSREMLRLHGQLVRHLVERHNFTTVVTETGLPESRSIFDYVNGQGGGSVPEDREKMYEKGLGEIYGAWVEGREMIEWMKDYNIKHSDPDDAKNALNYYGVDIGGFYQDWNTPMKEILGYLKRFVYTADEAYAILNITKRIQPFLDAMNDGAREYYIEQMTASERSDLALLLDEIYCIFQSKESEYVDRSDRSEYEWAKQSLISMQLAENYYRNYLDRCGDPETSKFVGLNGREIAMHRNILWVMRQRPTSKIIWINHVVHTKTQSQYQGDMWGFFTPAGEMLRQSIGSDLFTIGLLYGGGEYWKDWQKGAAEKRSVATVPDPTKDGLELTLASLTSLTSKASKAPPPQTVFVPWARAPVGAWPWLQSVCSMRENDYVLKIKPSEWQACIYIDKVSPATPASSCFE